MTPDQDGKEDGKVEDDLNRNGDEGSISCRVAGTIFLVELKDEETRQSKADHQRMRVFS